MKLATIRILFFCLWSNLVWSREDAMKFTRPTVKGLVLERAAGTFGEADVKVP